MALAGQVHTNLVGATGLDGHLQQRHGGQALRSARGHGAAHLDQCDGPHAIRVIGRGHTHAALAVGLQVFVQGQVDDFFVGRPGARDQCQIGLSRFSLTELVLQVGKR
ncbi:hypothetical protein D3C72_2236580 [compost metagenome]